MTESTIQTFALESLQGKTLALEKPLNFKVVEKKLKQALGEAVMQYAMISEGDKIMVCLSGGKVIGT